MRRISEMTDEEIDALEQLCAAATKPPWQMDDPRPGAKKIWIASHPGSGRPDRMECEVNRDDCDVDVAEALPEVYLEGFATIINNREKDLLTVLAKIFAGGKIM